MVIGFVPGSGGNRYAAWLKGNKIGIPNISYDRNPDEYYARFTSNDMTSNIDSNTISYCVNYPTLAKVFSKQTEFVIIKADIKQSLFRAFCISGLDRFMKSYNPQHKEQRIVEHYRAYKDSSWPQAQTFDEFVKLPVNIKNEVNYNRNSLESDVALLAAKEHIKYHLEYYSKYPMEFGNATVVDVETDQTEFGNTMRKEFDTPYTSEFEEAWNNTKW